MAPDQTLRVLLILLGVDIQGARSADWSYANVAEWKLTYPDCGGMKQSPINIDTNRVVWADLKDIDFDYSAWPNANQATMINNDHTVQVNAEPERTLKVTGGSLPCEYYLEQFHFHWGVTDQDGSEHTINGHSFPLEMHLEHYCSDYPDITQAEKSGDPHALLVLSVLFEISSTDNPQMDHVIDFFPKVTLPETSYPINTFPLTNLLPEDTSHYYSYSGSLTTPGCEQVVLWNVFRDTVQISSSQMAQFRTLLNDALQTLAGNHRPPQPLHGRTVYTNIRR